MSWILFPSLFLSSCGVAIKVLADIPNFKVHSNEEITRRVNTLDQRDNVIDLFPKSSLDENEIKNFLYMSILHSPYVFDRNNNLLCMIEDESCTVTNLSKLNEKTISESFEICDTITYSHNILRYFSSMENLISKTNFNNSKNLDSYEHKIIYFINSDISQDDMSVDWETIYQSFNNNNENVIFIRVWTDLNEDWGLKKNAMAKTSVKKVKGAKREFEMVIGKLPLKK